MSLFAHVASIILTVGVEWLPKWVPLGHGDSQDEVLKARDTEEDCVLVVGQVLGSRHCAVQRHVPEAGRGERRQRVRLREARRGSKRKALALCEHMGAVHCKVAGHILEASQHWPKPRTSSQASLQSSALFPSLNPHEAGSLTSSVRW